MTMRAGGSSARPSIRGASRHVCLGRWREALLRRGGHLSRSARPRDAREADPSLAPRRPGQSGMRASGAATDRMVGTCHVSNSGLRWKGLSRPGGLGPLPLANRMSLGAAMRRSNRTTGLIWAALFAIVFLTAPGCAMVSSSSNSSDSSASSSDSSGSFSDSSTSSSGGDSAYRGDVRTYTVAHVRAEGSPTSLRLGLSEVALRRGISDWEALPGTFIAVGTGLAEAGVSSDELSAYQNALARSNSANYTAIRQGFASATP